MRRLSGWSRDQIIEYNLRDGGEAFTVFEVSQPDRVTKAREIIASLLLRVEEPAIIVEPGCSTGDISGFFAADHAVTGIDVTPGACRAARERWPQMTVIEAVAEDVEPMRCDILVLCEFLEHIVDPIDFVNRWAPLARYIVIGHPLVGDAGDPEPGHLWAYTREDFAAWFPMGGHVMREAWTFGMASYTMAIGWGERA